MRIWRSGVTAVVVAGLATLTAGCGGGSNSSSPGVASMGSTTTAAASQANSGKGSSNYAKALAYSQCMQSHGVPNFPDPNSQGDITVKSGGPGGSGKARSRGGGGNSGFDPNSPEVKKAQKTCQHLLPNGGKLSPAEQQKMEAQALKFSECMRSHGVPNFPDPQVSSHGIGFRLGTKNGSNLNPQSPQFQRAQKACRSELPRL